MSRVVIPRSNENRGGKNIQPSPAWWWTEGLNDEPVIWLRCACGQLTGLSNHTVEPNGDVNPSVFHDVPECGWHEYVTLEGYHPPGHQPK